MNAARKLRTCRRQQRWAQKAYKKAHLGTQFKCNPFGGSSHCKGIVLEKMWAPPRLFPPPACGLWQRWWAQSNRAGSCTDRQLALALDVPGRSCCALRRRGSEPKADAATRAAKPGFGGKQRRRGSSSMRQLAAKSLARAVRFEGLTRGLPCVAVASRPSSPTLPFASACALSSSRTARRLPPLCRAMVASTSSMRTYAAPARTRRTHTAVCAGSAA